MLVCRDLRIGILSRSSLRPSSVSVNGHLIANIHRPCTIFDRMPDITPHSMSCGTEAAQLSSSRVSTITYQRLNEVASPCPVFSAPSASC